MKEKSATWLTNGEVAWEIPPGRTATLYASSAYVAPEPWHVVKGHLGEDWYAEQCGVFRKRQDGENSTVSS